MSDSPICPTLSQWHKAIRDVRGLSRSDKLVLWTLFAHADWKFGTCYPAVATLEAESGLGRRTVQRAIGTLSRLGILSCENRKGGRPGHATRYRLILHAIIERGVRRAPLTGASGAQDGRHPCGGGASGTTPTGVTGAPKLDREHNGGREKKRLAPPGGFDLEAMKKAAAEGVTP
jgi:hypothetical protein